MLNVENDAQPLDQVVSINDLERARKEWLILEMLPASALLLFLLSIIPLVLMGALPEPLISSGLPTLTSITGASLLLNPRVSNLRTYIRGIKRLQEIEPPEVIITKAYAVTRHMNTYVFVIKGAARAIYFVALEGTNLSPAIRVDVPRKPWKWNHVEHIEGLRVHKRTGVFSIPTPERRIVSGKGVLYALPLLRTVDLPGHDYAGRVGKVPIEGITRESILAVAEFVSKSVSDGGSGDFSF